MADVAADQNVVKYASSGKVDGDGVNGEVFVRRPIDTDGLSVNWLEHYEGSRSEQVAEISACSRITIRPTGRFAEVRVGAAAEAVLAHLDTFGTLHSPLGPEGQFPPDPSHCLFQGLPDPALEETKAAMLGDLISMRVHALHQPANKK